MTDSRLTARVAARHLLARPEPEDEGPAPGKEDVSPERLADLLVFMNALGALGLHISSGAAAATDPKGEVPTDVRDLHDRGRALLRRYSRELEAGLQKHLLPLTTRPNAGALKMWGVRLRQPASLVAMLIKYLSFNAILFPWLRSHQGEFRDVFPGRSYRVALLLAAALTEDTPLPRLNKMASIPTVSGLVTTRMWVVKAAAIVGVPLSAAEASQADAESAQAVASDLRQVAAAIDAANPMTDHAAELQDQRRVLVEQAEEIAAASQTPEVVRATVAATTAKAGSPIAKKFRLTPEQEDVMHTMGKVVIAAGAGSGKTSTLVATIEHLVEERGYDPGQILACSFTRAASSELEAKVVDKGGVNGCAIGTTHRVAREVISMARPDLKDAMRRTKNADKCFPLAMKQVEMDVAGFDRALARNKETMRRIESVDGWQRDDFLSKTHAALSRGQMLSEKWEAGLERSLAYKLKNQYGGTGSGWSRSRSWGRRYAEQLARLAVLEDDEGTPPEAATPGREKRFSPFSQTPAKQWFNLGVPLLDEKRKKMSEKQARLLVENFQNSGISVEAARQKNGDRDPVTALYGAYMWLKANDPVLGPCMDYTDQLVVALDILKNDPQARERMQAQFKVVMVDEAQDLNQIQFEMFQILGEHADLLAFIGDDKQSIYAFRGARPANYIDLSRAEGFQTRLMTVNFRSGSAIVDAANKLIAHNGDRQIPMTCQAHAGRGVGAIKAATAETHEDGANEVAQEIKDSVDSGASPADYGIIVRNNAEADAYTLALLARGVPYRTLRKENGGYFGRPVVRALTAWFRLVLGGSVAEVNEAVTFAHKTPGFNLDEMFETELARRAVHQSYLDYISSGGMIYGGDQAWRNKNVTAYADAIREVRILGKMDSPALIRAILGIKNPKGGSFEDALVRMVDREGDTDDDVTEEELHTLAMAPIRPLMMMADNFRDPANLLTFIQKMKDANERVQKATPDKKEDWKEPAVLVGTAHGWKGLQAKHVFVCMAGGIFPNFKTDEAASTDPTAYDEERRLAYVAITRGEDTVTVVAPQVTYLGRPSFTSRFVSEACIPVIGEEPQAPIGIVPDSGQEPSAEVARVASFLRPQTGDKFVLGLRLGMSGKA